VDSRHTGTSSCGQLELQVRLKKLSAEVFGGSVERTSKYMREEIERWGNVIKAAGVTLQ
jgi:tripartite-type tricarboxylate transporter receptor subunit TctC